MAVAFSGGRDSTALLHCVCRLARQLPLQVHALHVHHGLQPQADDWQRRLALQCRRWAARGMPLQFHAARVEGQPQAGDSVEAWARKQRYAALAHMAREQGCGIVLLAHHQGDQAETVLLQALRGAGPAGLAAMPRLALRAGITWARPWLERPRTEIEAYLRRHRLSYIDDPSNASPRFARNRLRHALWPALVEAFPAAETALAAAARRAHEGAELASELAAIDAALAVAEGRLRVAAWLGLGAARRRNLLRHWLAVVGGGPVPESLLDRLAIELPAKHAGRWPAGGGELRLHAGWLSWAVPGGPGPRPGHVALDLRTAGSRRLPGWGGQLIVEEVASGGVALDRLRRVCVRPRAGSERFQRAPASTARSLKKQFQAQGVPAWERDGPLLWAGDQLLFVAGLGMDARCIAQPGVPQRAIRWLPDAGQGPGPAG